MLISRDSFNELPIWLNEARQNVMPECVFVLIGTKNDLPRVIEYDEGIKFMKENNINLFFETSSKTGNNVQSTFELMTRELLSKSIELKTLKEKVLQEQQFRIEADSRQQKSKGCCG